MLFEKHDQLNAFHFCRIIILISDGRADSGNKPNDFARELKRSGVIIFAVGVASINRAELEEVATSPKHIYMLTSFPYIKEVNSDLRKGTVLGAFGSLANLFAETGQLRDAEYSLTLIWSVAYQAFGEANICCCD